MIQLEKLKRNIPYIISLLFVLLFVHAASSKLMDYQQFKVQLGQSPILTVYAGTVSWIVPLIELVLSFLLLFESYRLYALYTCLGLMTLFTTYIALMLNFSDSLPCSCGGGIAALGWKGHLYFNIFLMALALFGIFFANEKQKYHTYKNTT